MKEPDSPEQEEELLLSVLRDFPTVRATAVDMARLSPQNQKMIQNLVRNLAEGEDTALALLPIIVIDKLSSVVDIARCSV